MMDQGTISPTRFASTSTPGSRAKPDVRQYSNYNRSGVAEAPSYTSKYEELSHDNALRSKERQLEDRFNSLVNNYSRSKDHINRVHKATFEGTDYNKPQSTMVSPSQGGYRRSPNAQPQRSFDNALDSNYRSNASNIKVDDYERDRNTRAEQGDQNSRLEHEIRDLKNSILERLQVQEQQKKSSQPEKKTTRSLKLDTLSSSDDDQDTESDLDQHKRRKTSTKAHHLATTRSLRSPNTGGTTRKKSKKPVEPEIEVRGKKAVKNVTAMKNQFDEREAAIRDKYLNLKYKAKEMRSTLQEYVNKCIDLEEMVKNKDRALLDYEEQIKETQQELLRNFEVLQDTKRTEESVSKSEEELRVQNGDLKTRVQEQKRRLEEIEEQVKRNEEKYHAQIETLQHEKYETKTDLRDREEKLNHQVIVNNKLRDELDQLQKELNRKENISKKFEEQGEKRDEQTRELRERLEAIQIENKSLKTRNDDLQETKAYLEEKVSKYKKKQEEDKLKWQDEKDKEMASKRAKNKQLKADVKELEAVLMRVSDDKKTLALEVERTLTMKVGQEKELSKCKEEVLFAHQEIKSLRSNLDTLKSQNDDITRNFHKESDRLTTLQAENRKLTKQLQATEEKNSFNEKEVLRCDELNGRLRNELRLVLEENNGQKQYTREVEGKLEFFRGRQDDEITKFESRMNELEQEIRGVKEENSALKVNEGRLTADLEMLKDERDHYRHDYKALKQVNKTLEKDLKEIDERVKDFIHEKQLELHEQNREVTMQKQLSSKLKVLEDIQTMIKSHRHSHRGRLDFSEMA